ncbi:hypothetical protein [Streptomyces longispororuber]|uniref:hypothetical protein n=1 Tax=Streptomyces longispororuber TaxID=68230 RepID=UPI003702C825
MITISSLARSAQPPPPRSGVVRIASIDVEWTKNYRIKNGNRPFCYSVVWLDLPADGPADLADGVPFAYTSVYVDDPGEQDQLVATAADTFRTATEHADLITGHQLCADLGVLANTAPAPSPHLDRARGHWKNRAAADAEKAYLDTRYDAGHLLNGASRRLVDVCTELGLDVTQPELRRVTMPAWHRRWIDEGLTEGRERVSVLNLRHSLSTAYVAARAADLARWPSSGLNVNRALADGARGAFAWLDHPTFSDLLEDPCPSETAGLSPSKAPRPRARPRSSTR